MRLFGALVLASTVVLGGCPDKPPKRPQGDDSSKAFAELDKNDKDDPNAKADKKPEEEKPKGPIYPAPFTAEQIRDATRNGRTYRYKIEMPNKPAKEYTVTFRNVDEGGAEVHSGAQVKRMSWMNLQQHSEFPKDKVTTRAEKLKTPAGKFECMVYEVAAEEGEVWTYYFARKLPGAPIFFYVERDGKRLRTTTLVEHVAGK